MFSQGDLPRLVSQGRSKIYSLKCYSCSRYSTGLECQSVTLHISATCSSLEKPDLINKPAVKTSKKKEIAHTKQQFLQKLIMSGFLLVWLMGKSRGLFPIVFPVACHRVFSRGKSLRVCTTIGPFGQDGGVRHGT